jgi:hypothetical protein
MQPPVTSRNPVLSPYVLDYEGEVRACVAR